MSLPPDTLRRLALVARSHTHSFTQLVALAKLNPAQDFRGADLRFVDFGEDDLRGYNFHNADLRGADLSKIKGREGLILEGALLEDAELPPPPPDFEIDEVKRLVLAGKHPLEAWIPWINHLRLSALHLTDLTPVARLVNLHWLHLDFTDVSDLAPLSRLTGLQCLWLNGTLVTNLAPLSHLTNLQRLYIRNTQIEDITPLVSLVKLEVNLDEGVWVRPSSIKRTGDGPLLVSVILRHLSRKGRRGRYM